MILYDTLYYIKKMKEANTYPIEITVEEFFQFALNRGIRSKYWKGF
jgi:uncharacterized short protein YbdD (DUF466 family)